MLNFLLVIALLQAPVLYEGRYRPLDTLPKNAQYTPLEVEDYATLAGQPYLEAAGKSLYYPTYGQLFAEKLLHLVPFKWGIVALYLLGWALLFYRGRWGLVLIIGGFCLHTLALALRSYVLLRPPVANMEETLLYVPWVIMGIALLGKRTFLASGCAIAALLLLFLPSGMKLDPVQAVLDSQYWLMIHVLTVVGSYALFFLAGVFAHLLLFKRTISALQEKGLVRLLYIGTGMLICGTLLGGVWAAQSWGRFWDWDPKEAWAFISAGFYLLWIHAYRFRLIQARGLAIGAILGLMAITFTWYGVNYILGTGLHSYGFGKGGEWSYYLYLLFEILFLTGFLAKKLYKNWLIEKKERNR